MKLERIRNLYTFNRTFSIINNRSPHLTVTKNQFKTLFLLHKLFVEPPLYVCVKVISLRLCEGHISTPVWRSSLYVCGKVMCQCHISTSVICMKVIWLRLCEGHLSTSVWRSYLYACVKVISLRLREGHISTSVSMPYLYVCVNILLR